MEFIFNPKTLLEKINIQPDWVVADFGSGSGHWAVELAKLVGEKGKVYAIDILRSTLESVQTLAKIHNVSNIETRWSDIEKTSGLEQDSCDLVVISNLFFQADQSNYKIVLEEAFKVLKEDGRVLVVDWKPEAKIGPEQDQRASTGEIEKIGLSFFKRVEKIEAGENHWGLLFFK